ERGGEPVANSGRDWAQRVATLPLLPFHLTSGVLVESFGRSSWEIMLRRTQLLFHSDQEFEDSPKGLLTEENELQLPASGGLAVFLRDLQAFINSNGGSSQWEITVVGHSMGAIVMNRMLKEYPELPYLNLVYLGAACSVNDVEYVAREFLPQHPN